MTMNLDHEELHRLLATLAESDIQEFRLEGEDFCLEVKRNLGLPSESIASPKKITTEEIDPPLPQRKIEASAAPSTPPPSVPGSRSDLVEVTAPMVGTFYRAPGPEEPPFVDIGSRISVGQAVCILEAMKLMNELESEVSGEVVEILVENGTPVEFGQVLMRLKTG
ncbi:acetyl-CoA carboxylase biotin carboxyl carrier protein [Prochlorococcus marinus]|uniref:Biotin carboxyl carrier protein of acetyl-CoA carboxylase n=1 Tax=Prochlorococcus marinus XMU1408 TaxID=2213228 RepID=A0A318R5G8_PROMR|nr:acetyl-CoA carboxylase biotin carboxyl carrier protein [Prochlorococcus marinus]MBW3042588.1 acetyl-CoA carboxylase biotin carboxyl carrier protein [Prochlorococcus marinus str. XMU1408]PYE03633.1 acetyl-CoA carboxylase biotin carboxyl carrier protein [Prochlorococcus marinus XMU1408]